MGDGRRAEIYVRDEGPIANLVLSNPDQRNAFTNALLDSLYDVVKSLDARSEIRVVVIRGAGTTFASGMNLRELAKMDQEKARSHYEKLGRSLEAIEYSPKPYIAAIKGYALGGGLEIAAACDLRIACETARIGFPIGRFGHAPDRANLARLLRLTSSASLKRMIFTDTIMSARSARGLGLLDFVVEDVVFDDYVRSMALTVASKAPLALGVIKMNLRLLTCKDVDGPDETPALYETSDFEEGVSAFFAKRPPRFEGR